MSKKRVIALGFFDGVHLGHGALLRTCRQVADRLDATPCALSFDPHPSALLQPTPDPLLNTISDREDLMTRHYGMEQLLLLPFSREMMEMDWQDFALEYLIKRWNATALVCGHDYRFGRKGLGDGKKLATFAAEHGIECHIVGCFQLDGITVSSTYLRSLIAKGDMETAHKFYGHPHQLTAEVTHGKALGRQLGTPTANLLLPDGLLSPAFGVYACRVILESGTYLAVTNVGTRPTVSGQGIVVEPWILDFEGDLYGQNITVEFYKFLRPETKFPTLDALKSAILENAQQTRDFFEHL